MKTKNILFAIAIIMLIVIPHAIVNKTNNFKIIERKCSPNKAALLAYNSFIDVVSNRLFNREKKRQIIVTDTILTDILKTELSSLIKSSGQILIVTANVWNSSAASLSYYEKRKGKLIEVRGGIPVNLGSAGLGWGRGIVDFNYSDGPVKHEGDLRAPAGIFKLSNAFGYLPADSLKWLKYPYKQSTIHTECVDDTASEFYNTIVNTKTTAKTWKSSEKMLSKGNHYKYGIEIEHNFNPQIPGCGSCIFIHVWDGIGVATAGCTVLSEEEIIKLLAWMDTKKNPILIQLPQAEFDKIRTIINIK